MNEITIKFEEFDLSKDLECPKPMLLVRAFTTIEKETLISQIETPLGGHKMPLYERTRMAREACALNLIRAFLSKR
jgi:hypothetical protein